MDGAVDPARSRGHVFLLWGLQRRWLDVLLTAAVFVLLAWSRFGLLASGPWEWDETLFARGMLKFELAAHFPHPPGCPGWLALGYLMLPLAGEPYRALQLASAALSVVSVWPLAILGRRVAPPPVATCAALLVLVAPGPWLHSVRGFSSTPAFAFAVAGAAVACTPRRSTVRMTVFTVLVAAAFLIRPVLLPSLAVLWLAVAVSSSLRRLLPGVLAGVAMGGAAVWAMAAAEGGWAAFVRPFVAHANRHFSRLVDNPGGWMDLGLVEGFGGGWVGTSLLAAAGVGVVVWARRRGRRSAVVWVAVLSVTVAQLILLQNRTYTRYAVPVQLATAPLLAATAAFAPPAVACAGLLVTAAVVGANSYPLLVEQRDNLSAPWEAVTLAWQRATEDGLTVVVEPELHPFASYRWHLAGVGGVAVQPPLVLSPWAPEPWSGVDGSYIVATCHPDLYPDPPRGGRELFGGVSEALLPFTQKRFLVSELIRAPPLPLSGWWAVEGAAGGERFMWGTAGARLWLPAVPATESVSLELRPAPGPTPLTVVVDDTELVELDGSSSRTLVWIGAEVAGARTGRLVEFRRSRSYPPGGGDHRPLAVQLFAVRAVGRLTRWQGSVTTAEERAEIGLRVDGFHAAEEFGDSGRGCWVQPLAWLEADAGEGTLVLWMWAPRPTPPRTRILMGGRVVAGPLEIGAHPVEVRISVAAGDVHDGRVRLELDSVPFNPAAAGAGADERDLGVVLGRVAFEPALPVE